MTSDDRDDEEASQAGEDDSFRSFSDLVDAVDERRERGPGEMDGDTDGDEREPVEVESEPDDTGAEPDDTGTEPAEGDDAIGLSGLRDAAERRRALSEWEWVRFGPDAGRWATDVSGDPKTDALLEVLGDAANVLLVGPLVCPAEYEACTRLLATAGTEEGNALLVTFTESPDDRIDVCRGYLDGRPERTVVLSVGDHARSGSAAAPATTAAVGPGDRPVTIEAVPNPGDLVQIGMAISRHLSDWKKADARSVVCFHSLTALLRFADDLGSVFRFLHVLQSHVRATGARAHYHVEADAHDEETLATLRPLFDVVLTYDTDRPISVEW